MYFDTLWARLWNPYVGGTTCMSKCSLMWLWAAQSGSVLHRCKQVTKRKLLSGFDDLINKQVMTLK